MNTIKKIFKEVLVLLYQFVIVFLSWIFLYLDRIDNSVTGFFIGIILIGCIIELIEHFHIVKQKIKEL